MCETGSSSVRDRQKTLEERHHTGGSRCEEMGHGRKVSSLGLVSGKGKENAHAGENAPVRENAKNLIKNLKRGHRL